MTDRELMQQALDALDSDNPDIQLRAATALRARLAQPEPEPVAWMYEYGTDNGDAVNEVRWYKNVSLTPPVLTYNRNVVPLYAAPPQREWQGLTDEEVRSLWDNHVVPMFGRKHMNPIIFGRVLEAKLKEKNT